MGTRSVCELLQALWTECRAFSEGSGSDYHITQLYVIVDRY